MFDKLEKIQWIIICFVLFIFTGMFFFPGLSTPLADVPPPIKNVTSLEFKKTLNKTKEKIHDKNLIMADIAAKKAGGRNQNIERKYTPISKDIFEIVRDKRHALEQLRQITAIPNKKNNTLKISSIKKDSYWPSLGFKENDVIEFLNGKPIPFDDDSALWNLYNQKKKEVESGGSIIVTVNRGGKQVQMIYSLSDFRK